MAITLPFQWRPRLYQMAAWCYFEKPDEGKRAACVWHRRAGKDLFAINLCAVQSQTRVGLYWHMLPTYKQGRAIVWNGITRDGRKFLSHFPQELVESENATEMRITFKNESIYQVVGTDNIDSLVGTNPVGVVFSEYSLHDPKAWDLIRPILAENGGWALFIYTARGKNHGYSLMEMAKKNPKWFSQVLTAGNKGTKRPDGTPVISDDVINEERAAGMPKAMIEQEFFCSFDAPFVGAYYGDQMATLDIQGRIMSVPHDPHLPVSTSWDIGVGDSTAIWFFQEYGFEIRVIDYYENSGEGLGHYAKLLKGQVEGKAHMGAYTYGVHYAPHDIEVREFTSGKARIEAAREMGIKFSTCRKHEVEDGIEATRSLIPLCWFDAEKCQRGIEALRQYRKEWDDKNKVFKDHALHDWTSHPADAFRIFVMGRKTRSKYGSMKRQERAIDEYSYGH